MKRPIALATLALALGVSGAVGASGCGEKRGNSGTGATTAPSTSTAP